MDVTIQAKDLGGFGGVSGGSPAGGRTRGSKNRSEKLTNGSALKPSTSTAPQQAMPATPPQQWLAQLPAPPAFAWNSDARALCMYCAGWAIVGDTNFAGVACAPVVAELWCACPSCAEAIEGT